jgi:hypothetical protein
MEILLREEGQFVTFTHYWDEFVVHKGWVLLNSAEGKPFASYQAYARSPRPHGLGMSPEQWALHEEAGRARTPSLFDLPVLNDYGGDHTTDEGKASLQCKDAQYGNSEAYLVRRLKRDEPEIAEALERGEYRSVRAAGIAAGFVKIESPLVTLKRAWGKASPEERETFREWTRHEKGT